MEVNTFSPSIHRLVAILALVAAVTCFKTQALVANEYPPEVPDRQAVEAFKQYWQAFDAYEKKRLKEASAAYQQQWDKIKAQSEKDKSKALASKKEALQKAVRNYKKHLEDVPSAANRPFVIMNLAQVLNLLGNLLESSDPQASNFAKTEAIAYLRDIEEKYPAFSHRDEAMYLLATTLETLGRSAEATPVWKRLAKSDRPSLHAAHANLALGDRAFESGNAKESLAFFERAKEITKNGESETPSNELVRINYRIAWAAYKSAELEKVIDAASALLEAGIVDDPGDKKKKIQQDAAELIGDALFEANNHNRIRDTLRRKELLNFGSTIGLRTLQRFKNNGINDHASKVGELLLEEFPTSIESPEIISITASAYEAQKKTSQQFYMLEQLAMFLPSQSLWRSRHKTDYDATRRMESLATDAARKTAEHHYESGLASGNIKSFITAGSFFGILVERFPSDEAANQWRLRIANCHFFAGNLDEAFRHYADLKSKYKVDRATLEIASYQEVLTHEKRWRSAFEKSVLRGEDPIKDPEAIQTLESLEKAADEFANRFPTQSRAVDVLLVAGSANRDQDRFDQAGRFWQRSLVANPSPSQRAIAIRGLVFANMKNGSPSDVIASAGKFLKLEDWKSLGLTLGTELKGVLSSATLDEGSRLSKDGKVYEAGSLMVSIANEFTDLPQRDKIFRDGAYMLAIAGYWAEAQAAAESYMKTRLTTSRADMHYLLARCHEFQIRLGEAAKTYLDMGQKYPKHSRSIPAIQRAESLAVAEGNYKMAAEAAALLAERVGSPTDRLAALNRAVDYSTKAELPRSAMTMAQRRLESSKSNDERFRSQLLLAKSSFAAGREQQAIDDLEILAKRLDQQRTALGSSFGSLAGETNFLLGEEAQRRFQDFSIFDRSGTLSERVAEKSRLFEATADRYNKSAVAGDPNFAAQSRHRLAEAAESFANEVAAIPARKDLNLTLTSQARYAETAKRLKDMARKYLTDNVMAQRKDPTAYRNNEWVRRSAIKLSALGDKSWDTKTQQDVVPTAAKMELPHTYNLH